MSDWTNTPIKHRLDAYQVKVADTSQNALVGTSDAAYYADVRTNAAPLDVPGKPTPITFTDGTDSTGTLAWTNVLPAQTSYSIFWMDGSGMTADVVVAQGKPVYGGIPGGTDIATGEGEKTVVVAGVNVFGVGPYAIVTETITQA